MKHNDGEISDPGFWSHLQEDRLDRFPGHYRQVSVFRVLGSITFLKS